MSTIKVNTLDSTTGTTITVPTGKSLVVTDVGALTIGGIAITVGSGAVISKTATYTILTSDFTNKSSLVVLVDVSSGTGTEAVITLPAPVDFTTCAIHVVSTATHGAGNKITIKNSAAAEVYTLYDVRDHCELVSDGTNTQRTGDEWVTVRGDVALTANYTIAAATTLDLFDAVGAGYSEEEDIGGCWSTTTDDFTAPFAGLYMLAGSLIGSAYCYGYGLKKNGTFIQAIDSTGIMYSNAMFGLKPFVLAKDDVITWWASENASTTHVLDGNASGALPRCTGDWWCLRRY
jgi:hypothetical protein